MRLLSLLLLGLCNCVVSAGVGEGGGVVAVSAGHVGGTRGSGIVPSATDVLGIVCLFVCGFVPCR